MSSSSQEPSPSKSSRRRRKHSRTKNSKNKNKPNTTMAIPEPLSPESPFSWRLERNSPSPSKSQKSHGIAPSRFHAKFEQVAGTGNHPQEGGGANKEQLKQPSIPAWKQEIERNLLIQEQKAHMGKLEARRKEFRKNTQLKTWPLQDMAMEHLDHLLGADASRQFHGGDYLSAESSSSVSSIESSKPRLAPKSKPATPAKDTTREESTANPNRNKSNEKDHDSTTQQSTEVDPREERSSTDKMGTEQKKEHRSSPLWSLEPRIFATEKGNGKRKYLVGEFGRIADWYWRKTAPTSRHLYEVIREGSPCRLYFDLEYSKADNPNVPEVQLLRELEDELVTELELHYGSVVPKLKSSQIVNLDSSNEKKFSRHWIVHLVDGDDASNVQKEFLFQDAPTVGRFVKRMVGRLADDMAAEGGDFAQKRPALAKHLFVKTKDTSKPTCFIDLGVYTRNRLFRCLGSSKKGKSTRLQVVQREVQDPPDPQQSTEQNDEDDPVEERCYFPLSIPDKKEIESSQSSASNIPSMETFIVANDWEPYAQALADSLVVPLTSEKSDKTPSRILQVEEGSYGSGSIANFTDASRKPNHSKYPPTTSMARQVSPIPSLDQYVTETLATRGGVKGSIRAWSIEYGHRDTPVSFTYHLQRNRFCEMVGRSHKSNNVFWTIDLNSWTCIQGCHDPDCFGRGSPMPISNNAQRLDAIQKEYESWQEEEFEKALGELNLEDIVAAPSKEDASSSSSNSNKSEDKSTQESDDLSDEALLQAIVDNPELFP